MFEHQTTLAECTIRNEIKDWFKNKHIEEKFETINDTSYDHHYVFTIYKITGYSLKLFNFRPDLDVATTKKIDRIFKSLEVTPTFITFPQSRQPENHQSSSPVATNILTTYQGDFMNYLSLEDILSLEIANTGQNFCYDAVLDHDIQKFLRDKFPMLYTQTKSFARSLPDFRLKDVLRHFIQKYHNCFSHLEIRNIISTDEIQSLSRSYNIQITYPKIFHIDFKSTHAHDMVDFCGIYHLDPMDWSFSDYDPKSASEHYSINFHADNTLGPLECARNNEFSNFELKSHNNYSPQKSYAVLQFVAKHFRTCGNVSKLTLYEFDLNHVSSHILNALLGMMHRGWLGFDTMNFKLDTLIAILDQCDRNRLIFRNCRLDDITDDMGNSNKSLIKCLWFCDMDIAISLFYILKNVESLEFRNCQISSTSQELVYKEITDEISFLHTSFDVATLMKLLSGLQRSRILLFVSCVLKPYDRVEKRHFIVRNLVRFSNMIFHLRTFFQIIENCEVENRILFENCHFVYENDGSNILSHKPLKLQFHHTKFDAKVLQKLLETLNTESKIFFIDSCILPLSANDNYSNKRIRLKYIEFTKCRIEPQTLLYVLGKMSRQTEVVVINCELLESPMVDLNISTNLSKIVFRDMKFNTNNLFALLRILKLKSEVYFQKCELTGQYDNLANINLQRSIHIHFTDMVIESWFAQILLQTDTVIFFKRCSLKFLTDQIFNTSIQSHVIFRNMTFDVSRHLKSLAKFTRNSKIDFRNCHFALPNSRIPDIVIKPFSILFFRISFDLNALVTIMERLSEHTEIVIYECDIRLITHVFSIRPIKNRIHFKNMNLPIETILCALKNFTSQAHAHFINCKIENSNPNAVPNIILKLATITFDNMNVDVETVQTLVQKCTKGINISLNQCKIIPALNNTPTQAWWNIEVLNISNMKYSPEILQILQYLNEQSTVIYHDILSNRTVIEICTKTPVYGDRLQLPRQIGTKSFHFELFAEFYRSIILNKDLDMKAEYDLPINLIPRITSIYCHNQYDWNEFKIKFCLINDGTVKIEFLKNGKPFDLYYELNGLPEDSDECLVNYY